MAIPIQPFGAAEDIPENELSLEDAQALMIKDFGGRAGRDGRICICGHPMSYHQGVDPEEKKELEKLGVVVRPSCRPTKMDCSCVQPRPVILTRDTRCFLFATSGSAPTEHALRQGIRAANAKAARTDWFVPHVCDNCGKKDSPENRVHPTGIRPTGGIAPKSAPINKLLCYECREKLW